MRTRLVHVLRHSCLPGLLSCVPLVCIPLVCIPLVCIPLVCIPLVLPACEEKPTTTVGVESGIPPAAASPEKNLPEASVMATDSLAAAPPRKRRTGPCPKEATVTFDDPTLEAVVRRQLQQPTGPIARADLHKIKTLDLAQAKSDDALDPCMYGEFTGVKGLYLAAGTLEDVTPLKGLTLLESLRLASTAIKDLSPLVGLGKMDRLDLSHTPVEDITPLASMVNLTELQLDDTLVADLSPLSKTRKLEMLSIQNTRISDLGPLRVLSKLKKLYIGGSLVKDISPVQSIPGLKIFQAAQ
jgi:internalin A